MCNLPPKGERDAGEAAPRHPATGRHQSRGGDQRACEDSRPCAHLHTELIGRLSSTHCLQTMHAVREAEVGACVHCAMSAPSQGEACNNPHGDSVHVDSPSAAHTPTVAWHEHRRAAPAVEQQTRRTECTLLRSVRRRSPTRTCVSCAMSSASSLQAGAPNAASAQCMRSLL